MLGVIPPRRAGRNENLRHVFGIEIFLHRDVRRRADGRKHCQHFILLDQLAGLLDRLCRRIAVVQGEELDSAAVDAALVVEHLEVGGFRTRDRAIGRCRPAIGRGVAELDGDLGRIGCWRRRRTHHRQQSHRQQGSDAKIL
jgi:hypothetical protein